jgi:hypothetical protein
VISFRAEPELLPALLDCLKSHDFCYTERLLGQTKHRWSTKSPHVALGVLLRWSYTEIVISHLQRLVTGLTPDSETAKELLWFTQLLRMVELPGQIGLAEDIYSDGHVSSRHQVGALQEWSRKAEPLNHRLFGFGSMGCLAVRRDLPPLDGQTTHKFPPFFSGVFAQ